MWFFSRQTFEVCPSRLNMSSLPQTSVSVYRSSVCWWTGVLIIILFSHSHIITVIGEWVFKTTCCPSFLNRMPFFVATFVEPKLAKHQQCPTVSYKHLPAHCPWHVPVAVDGLRRVPTDVASALGTLRRGAVASRWASEVEQSLVIPPPKIWWF